MGMMSILENIHKWMSKLIIALITATVGTIVIYEILNRAPIILTQAQKEERPRW